MSARERQVWPGPTPEGGLTCRKCGCGHFRTIYTRKSGKGRILRRRECRYCGKRVTTIEIEQPGDKHDDTEG